MKKKNSDLTYVGITLLLTVFFWLIQRPLMDGILALFIRSNNLFVSVTSYMPLYLIGTLLLASSIAWKIKSKKEPSSGNQATFLGIKLKRSVLFIVSLVLIIISISRFQIFTNTQIYSINILSSTPVSSLPYSEISEINILGNFHIQKSVGSGSRPFSGRSYCVLGVSITAQSRNGQSISNVRIPVGKMEELGNIIKSNNTPTNIERVNNCGNYSIAVDQKSLIEDSIR